MRFPVLARRSPILGVAAGVALRPHHIVITRATSHSKCSASRGRYHHMPTDNFTRSITSNHMLHFGLLYVRYMTSPRGVRSRICAVGTLQLTILKLRPLHFLYLHVISQILSFLTINKQKRSKIRALGYAKHFQFNDKRRSNRSGPGFGPWGTPGAIRNVIYTHCKQKRSNYWALRNTSLQSETAITMRKIRRFNQQN